MLAGDGMTGDAMTGDAYVSHTNGAFAQFSGWINGNEREQRFNATINPAAVSAINRTGYFAVQVTARAGTSFDPDTIEVRRVGVSNVVGGVADAVSSIITPRFAQKNLSDSTDSLAMLELEAGEYEFIVRGETSGTKGAFQINAYLIGDVTGDHRVDQVDRDALRFMVGAVRGDDNYHPSADFDFDGAITATDLQHFGIAAGLSSENTAPQRGIAGPTPLEDPLAEDKPATRDRISAIVPTTGYNQNAESTFFESTKGLVQPLSSELELASGVWKVPGVDGTQTTLTFTWSVNAGYNNVLGYYVTNADGTAGSPAATDSGVIFRGGKVPGESVGVNLEGGTLIGFYLTQDGSSSHNTWHSVSSRNADGQYPHFQQPSGTTNTWEVEDLSNVPASFPNPRGYTVNDMDFNDAVFSIEATPYNHAPVANDDFFEVDENQSVQFLAADLLVNDTDEEGDTLTVVSIDTLPLHGQITTNSSGDWTYYPQSGYVGGDDVTYTITDGSETASGTIHFVVFAAAKPSGNLWAKYPQTIPLSGLQWIGPNQAALQGVGIRRNGDADNIGAEDDLIQVDWVLSDMVSTLANVPPPGTAYNVVFKRSNTNIEIWAGSQKTNAMLTGQTMRVPAPANLQTNSDTFWVEWVSMDPAQTEAGVELWFEPVTAPQLGYKAAELIFHPFTSVVISFVGEHQLPIHDNGLTQMARTLYHAGYDVHVFDEDDVQFDAPLIIDIRNNIEVLRPYNPQVPQAPQVPPKESLKEVTNAVNNRGVSEVAIVGYSHGGGATYVLSEQLIETYENALTPFALKYTAYIDAVKKGSGRPETRMPALSAHHVNLWQQGVPLQGFELIQGDFVGGASLNDNVDSGHDGGLNFPTKRLHTHRKGTGIAEASNVQDIITSSLKENVAR